VPSFLFLATVTVIRSAKNKRIIFVFAVLDSLGVLLYYFTKIPLYFGAIYFAIYTGISILSALYLDSPEYLSDQILVMKEKGIRQRVIARELNISESKVSRLLNRDNRQNGNKSVANSNVR